MLNENTKKGIKSFKTGYCIKNAKKPIKLTFLDGKAMKCIKS